jgi:hypothetical protein
LRFSRSISFGTKPLPPKPTGIGLGLVGILLLLGAGLLAKSTYELEQSGVRTQAVVVKLERSKSSHYPVFRFRDVKGRELTVRSSTSSKSYFVGDSIPILYDPQSPLDAYVDEPLMLYLLPGIFGILGILFLFGMFMVLKMLPFFERAYDQQRAHHENND